MKNELRHLDIYSGIGGFSVGFEAEGFQTVGFSEIDPAASIVLKHWWPRVRNYGNARDIGDEFRKEIGVVDVLTAGVPCQPASLLGERLGSSDERWEWPNAIRMVRLFRPRYAVFENPPAILTLEDGRAFNGIVSELATLGYDCMWESVPAAVIGAGHLRERVFIIAADAQGVGNRVEANKTDTESNKRNSRIQSPSLRLEEAVGVAPNTDSKGLEGHDRNGKGDSQQEEGRSITPQDLRGRVSCETWWHEAVTGIPVLVNGLPSKLSEAAARCTGNAVVPQVAQIFARAIRNHITAYTETLSGGPP